MCEEVQRLLEEHLRKSGVQKPSSQIWEIRKSKHGGRGVFARRDLAAGEVVFVDYPLILGPRTTPEEVCVKCYTGGRLNVCECGLLVCGEECGGSSAHKAECEKIKLWTKQESEVNRNLFRCLTPIRALLLDASGMLLMRNLAAHLNPVHGTEVNTLKHVMKLDIPREEEELMRIACAVLDANAFEVLVRDEAPTLRGLYPLASLMNHNCTPNTAHVFDAEHFMVLRATVPIKRNDELFTSYSRLIWGTLSRRFHLFRTKHFACGCQRCNDPTEFHTYMNAIICDACGGKITPTNPLKTKSDWICEACSRKTPVEQVGFITTALAKRLTTLDTDDLHEIIGFYKERIGRIVPESNQIFLEMKYRVIWMLGYKDGYRYAEISNELLKTKIKFCRDILTILELLRLGQCKMRGLLLYEMFKCDEETRKRNMIDKNNNEENLFNAESSLAEIANIFLFDVSAPKEIRQFWRDNNIDSEWRHYL